MTVPTLSYPDLDAEFILDTDASNQEIGAMLSPNVNGEERMIACGRVLTKRER